MPYTYVRLSTALSDLGKRLYDPNSVYWTDPEKTAYIQEALRTWNAHTGFWRSEFVLDLIQNTVWYDIADSAVAPNTTRPFTITDVDLYKLVQYHFLEPATGATWTGSLQFNAQDLLQAVQRRRDELLSGSGCTIKRTLVTAAPGRTFLDDKVIDIRRVAWLPVTSPSGYTNSPLSQDDQFALESYSNNYTTQAPGQPTQFRRSTEPPLAFDVDIDPAVPGEYEVLSVNAGANLSVASPTVLNIPDDFAWVIKFGAMGDLMSRDSNAKDVLRSQYSNLRFKQGVSLLYNSPAVLYARLNNIPLDMDSVQNADNFRCTWQAQAAGAPDICLTAGLNMLGFATTPDAGPYSATLMAVRNAPVPVNGPDFLQVGRDIYDVILDYAVHIASFKMGGLEFLQTLPLYQRFITMAENYNSKLKALGEYTDYIMGLSRAQILSNPVYDSDSVVSDKV